MNAGDPIREQERICDDNLRRMGRGLARGRLLKDRLHRVSGGQVGGQPWARTELAFLLFGDWVLWRTERVVERFNRWVRSWQ